MRGGLSLGRILGVPVRLHWTWFLIFALVTWSLAQGYFPAEYPGLTIPAYYVLGGITSVLFFVSVLLHELGHSVVARRNHIPVRDITLFIFGGVAQIEREPKTAGAEFRIAIAGPLTSLVLAGVFAGLWWLDRMVPYLAAPSLWLMRINLILALFNLIPGFPLDGGRVLRAAIWKLSGSFFRATQIAVASGQVVAFGFIGVGIVTMLGGNVFNGLWLAAIGWFLQNATAATYAQANMQQMLQGVTVEQVMNRECQSVPQDMLLTQLVEERILTGGNRCFFVTRDDRLLGVLTLRDVTRMPRGAWGQITVAEAMVPWERAVWVQPQSPLLTALQTMDDASVNQLPVVEGGRIVGVLSREQVLHYIRTRAELGI